MTNHTNTDDMVLRIAEEHRTEYNHSVVFMPGNGWVCKVCDEDWGEVIAEYDGEVHLLFRSND